MDLEQYLQNEKTKYTAIEYEKLLTQKQEALALQESDPSLKEMAEEEIKNIDTQLNSLKEQMDEILREEKVEENFPNEIILEVRAGAGGDEASLFAYNLSEMYKRYFEKKGWQVFLLDASENDMGGYKEASFEIHGRGVYKELRFETGVHRVQRIPVTEKAGRTHTSTASVAILPIRKQTTITIRPEELEYETSRSGGKGGQNVNKVETAVRIIHIPTGLDVRCTSERSQLKNKEKALAVLTSKLEEKKRREEEEKYSAERKSQVGTGDRSEKIRTYNYPQNRITDHRINQTWHSLEKVMLGELEDVFEALEKELGGE